MQEKIFRKRKGKVIVQAFVATPEDFTKGVQELEQYLNDKVATQVFKKFQTGIRFQL